MILKQKKLFLYKESLVLFCFVFKVFPGARKVQLKSEKERKCMRLREASRGRPQ